MQNSIESKKHFITTASKIAKQNIETNFNSNSFDSIGDFITVEKNKVLNDLSTYLELSENSFVLIADLDGDILVTTYLPYEGYLNKYNISKEIIFDVLNSDNLETFNNYQTLGDVFAISHLVSPQLLTSKDGEAFGVLFFCSDSVYERFFVNRIINIIIMNCLWVLVAAMVIVYFMTEKIVSPVREMSKAAKSFSLGRFDVRIPVKGNKDEIGELASAFNDMAALLAVNEETQRSFLSNVSHDLRTPMMSIGGFVDSILDGTIKQEEQEYYLNIVSTEIRRLSRLVSSLLDITKIQAGETKFNKKNFDICETARIVIISLEQKIDAKHIEIDFDCTNEKMCVFADSDAVQRIIYNLVENAIKFTPEKGLIKIHIKENDKDKKIYVSVYNTGTGIPADDIPFVFDRFYKSDRSRGLDKTGVGLGLFIVKTMIDAHEEKIWVTSEYEKYCEFTFTMQKSRENNVKYKI